MVVALASCSNPTTGNAARQMNREAERAGSPHRYRAQSAPGGSSTVQKYRVTPPVPVPVPADLAATRANAQLQKDVLAKIADIQHGWAGKAAPVLLGVKAVEASAASIQEIWFVKQGNGAARYTVTMTPGVQGGTAFTVTGPVE